MKILAASDLHCDTEAVKRLAKEATDQDVDMILILGDISVFGDLVDGMIGPLAATKKKIAFVTGNHELPGVDETLSEKYEMIDIERAAFMYRDVGVFGAGGANVGPFNYTTDDDLFDNIKRGFRYVKNAKKKILATHVHPSKSLIEKFSFPGSGGVKRAIDEFKPDVHLCGHIHEMEGFEEKIGNTRVLCVGKRGKIIEI